MGKQYSKTHREALLKFARSAIAAKLGRAGELPDEKIAHLSPVLMEEKRGVFVTLHKKGNLRGCIGNIEPVKSVREGIRENSEHAAFRDTRFPPLTPGELDEIDIEVSILTDPERLRYKKARDLVSKLTPNVDGVILKKGHQRATFLPQVWEQLTDPDDFLNHLCVKAGLKADEWKKGELEVYVYQVESFEESKRS